MVEYVKHRDLTWMKLTVENDPEDAKQTCMVPLHPDYQFVAVHAKEGTGTMIFYHGGTEPFLVVKQTVDEIFGGICGG